VKRTPWKRKPPAEGGNGLKRSPMKRSNKPMKKVGRKGKLNAKADKNSKAEFERRGIDYCQLCGTLSALSRSHSYKKRFDQDLERVALLCIFRCHTFIELELDAETRASINEFIIDTNLEGEAKFEAVLKLMPENKVKRFTALFSVS
jgi:hypothetical protein